ncbi:MAG: hypothetical protein HQ495_09360 [Alphaproteobacteria bacterium]|nr:hypothetical protein [Alphaproteobacteria bacterium]
MSEDHTSNPVDRPDGDRWVRLDRLLRALAEEISIVRQRKIRIADRIGDKITESGSEWLRDAAFMAVLQDFDLMSQELDHVSSLLAAIGESLQHRDAVEVAVDHGIDAVKLSSMRARLRAAVYDETVGPPDSEDQDELW